jgi:hypothetical protein
MLRHAIIVTAFCGSRDTETCTIVKWVVRAVILLFFRVDFVSFEWGTCRCERDGDSGGEREKEDEKTHTNCNGRTEVGRERNVSKEVCQQNVHLQHQVGVDSLCTTCNSWRTEVGDGFFRKEFDGRVTAESPSAGHNGPLWLWPRMVNLL